MDSRCQPRITAPPSCTKVRETCAPGFAGRVLVASRGGAVAGFVSFGPHEWWVPEADRALVGELWNNAVWSVARGLEVLKLVLIGLHRLRSRCARVASAGRSTSAGASPS
jgi:hypothetical protein